jgi:hypothetical protein
MTEQAENAEQLLQALAEADNRVATATGALKHAKEEYEAVADRVFKLMDEQGTETIRNSRVGLQVTISEDDKDVIEDWTKFSAFVLRHKALHLLQRRISPVALREMVESLGGEPVPGLGHFSVRRLHVTKFSKSR